MVAELTALRDQIDEVDKALLSLLAKRLELVAEVGEVKSQYGLPIYVPERESAMLASRREEAAALGVPPDLIEDVLRRVMRESYSSENDKGFKTLYPNLRPVVIVSGHGWNDIRVRFPFSFPPFPVFFSLSLRSVSPKNCKVCILHSDRPCVFVGYAKYCIIIFLPMQPIRSCIQQRNSLQ